MAMVQTKTSPGRPLTDADLRKVGARRRLANFRERQAIVDAALGGRPQTVIAKNLGVSQPHVSRVLAEVKRQNHGTLAPVPVSALEIIDERDADEITTAAMISSLKKLDYTDGHVPDVAGVATDAYVRGSWDDIEFAFQRDKLTFEEYSELFTAHRQQQRAAAALE